MTSEAGVEAVAQNFLQGNYSLDMEAIAGSGLETTPGNPAAGDSSKLGPPSSKPACVYSSSAATTR